MSKYSQKILYNKFKMSIKEVQQDILKCCTEYNIIIELKVIDNSINIIIPNKM